MEGIKLPLNEEGDMDLEKLQKSVNEFEPEGLAKRPTEEEGTIEKDEQLSELINIDQYVPEGIDPAVKKEIAERAANEYDIIKESGALEKLSHPKRRALVGGLSALVAAAALQFAVPTWSEAQSFPNMNREQLVEKLLDEGAVILNSSGKSLQLNRSDIGRKLVCFSEDKQRMSIPEVTPKMFREGSEILVRCVDGQVNYKTAN